MILEATPVFDFLHSNYKEGIKQIFVLEGSSGSSKTMSTIQFWAWYAQVKEGKKVTCARAKMTWTISSIWEDVNTYLRSHGYKYQKNEAKYTIHLNDVRFRFTGADDAQKFHGPRQDGSWFNEAMELSKNSFDHVNMRTNDVFILDYNPSATTHWIYDNLIQGVKPIKNDEGETFGAMKTVMHEDEDGNELPVEVYYLKSTFRLNKFLPPGQRAVILGYDPSNPDNVRNGTADEYKWKVYGLGERAEREGIIFTRWRTGEFNEDIPHIWGIDFGATDPFTLTKFAFDRDRKIVWLKNYVYKTELNTSQILALLEKHLPKNDLCIVDSAAKTQRLDLASAGYNVYPSYKEKVLHRLTDLRAFEIVVCDSPDVENELRNYVWLDNKSNTPIDKYNHVIDPLGYCHTYIKRNY